METHHLQRAQAAPATISVVDHHFKRLADHRRGCASFRPALFDLSPRWQWWPLTILNKRMPPPAMPYPRIDFAQGFPEGAAPLRMLRQCLGGDERKFDGFLDWLLFNFGAYDQRELAMHNRLRALPNRGCKGSDRYRLQERHTLYKVNLPKSEDLTLRPADPSKA